MARKINQKKGENAIVIIVDGKDEQWYLEKVKEHYAPEKLRSLAIKPDLPVKKKVKDLFEVAHNKVNEGYTQVILVIDFDEVMKDKSELNTFKIQYGKYLEVNSTKKTKASKYDWMRSLRVIVNNPCLEYWYLLYFKNTHKFYSALEPDLIRDLKRNIGMENYEKSERYYKNSPDIFMRLQENGDLNMARKHSIKFDIERFGEQGCSEMFELFDLFDGLIK